MKSKSRKLKVGDRIAIYGLNDNCKPIRIVTTITGFAPYGVPYVNKSDAYKPGINGFDLTMPHPKQCRRLVKKK